MRAHAAPAGAGLAAFALVARICWPGEAAGFAMGFLLDAIALLAAAVAVLAADRARLPRAAVLLAALGGWALLSRSWAGEALPAWATGMNWVAAGAVVLACGQGARGGALHALCAAAAAQAAYAIWQLHLGLPALREYLRANPGAVEFRGRERDEFLSRLNTDEPFGNFPTSNVLCAFLAISLPVLVGRLLDATSWRVRALLAAPIIAGIYAALLTRSLGGFVALAASASVFAWRARWPEPSRTRSVVGASALALALAVGALLLALRPGRFDWTNPKSSLGYRANYARGTLGVIRNAPALGVGASNWDAHYTRYMAPTAGEAQRAHCDPLQVLAELGPVGLALFLTLPVALLVGARTGPPVAPSGFPWAIAIGAGLAWCIHGALDGRFGESGALTVLAQLALGAAALAGSAAAPCGRFTSAGALAGAAAFLTHGLVEYDLYVPGVLFAAAAVFASGPALAARVPSKIPAAAAALLAAMALLPAGRLPAADAALAEALARPSDPAAMQAALDLAEDARGPWRLAGAIHGVPGHNPADCLAAIDRGIALAPHAAGLRFNRARLQWDHASSDDALADFRLAVELYPNLAIHRFWLARALRARGAEGWRGHYEAALALSAAADMPRRALDPEEEAEARAAVGE